ncbi:MAG: EI24 domain-containing protein [Alphaproteobacteria bacterium]|nr:EI24 domain-containing protein [Alphaproteobacteria bacterium SS10]
MAQKGLRTGVETAIVGAMLHDLFSAFADLRRPQVLLALVVCIVTGLVVLFTIPGLAWLIFGSIQTFEIAWIDSVISALAVGGSAVLAFLLFPVVMTAIVGLAAEPVLDPIEADYEAYLPPQQPVPIVTALISSLKLILIAGALSLFAMLFFWTGISVFVAWVINSYLLSREFVTMVAMRRVPEKAVDEWRRRNREAVMFRGGLIAVLFAIPVLNLIAPIIAAAMVSHWLSRTDIYELATTKPPQITDSGPDLGTPTA